MNFLNKGHALIVKTISWVDIHCIYLLSTLQEINTRYLLLLNQRDILKTKNHFISCIEQLCEIIGLWKLSVVPKISTHLVKYMSWDLDKALHPCPNHIF